MLNLFGRVSMDTSGWTNAMAKMKATAGPAGAQIGQQIRGKMLEAFGAGAAIALFKKSLQRATEISTGATSAGVGTSQFQALEAVAKASGQSVEELIKQMEGGGPAATELADAVALAREEMERTGQLIDSETVRNLTNLSDKMDQLFGRLAPGLAMFVDFLSRIYDFVSRMVGAAVAGGQIAIGQVTGDAAMVQAGREGAREAFNPQQQESEQSAVRTAAAVAARVVREANREEGGGGGGSSRGARAERAAQVSSLVASGAVWNVGAVTQNRTMQVMQNEVARIRAILERGRD